MSGLRVVFFGTPAFAVPSLQALAAASGIKLLAVVTRPDRARGRGQERIESPPVAMAATTLGIPVLQPARPSQVGFIDQLTALSPDAFAVVAYGHLIPDAMLALARHGAWNVHPSLLPRWRGPAPIHRAIWSGDDRTGVCIIRLVAEMDAGPVAMRSDLPLGPRVKRGELEGTLAALGADLLVRTLDRVAHGTVELTEQDHRTATYAGMFSEAERQIVWEQPAVGLDRLIRALQPVPGGWCRIGTERLKIINAELGEPVGAAPGTLVAKRTDGGWQVACASGSLWIISVQPEGKSAMPMDAFVNGRRLSAGSVL